MLDTAYWSGGGVKGQGSYTQLSIRNYIVLVERLNKMDVAWPQNIVNRSNGKSLLTISEEV